MNRKQKVLGILGWAWFGFVMLILYRNYPEETYDVVTQIIFFLSPGLFALRWRQLTKGEEKACLSYNIEMGLFLAVWTGFVVYFGQDLLLKAFSHQISR